MPKELNWETRHVDDCDYMHCNFNAILPKEIRVWVNGGKIRLTKKEAIGLFKFLAEILLEDE